MLLQLPKHKKQVTSAIVDETLVAKLVVGCSLMKAEAYIDQSLDDSSGEVQQKSRSKGRLLHYWARSTIHRSSAELLLATLEHAQPDVQGQVLTWVEAALEQLQQKFDEQLRLLELTRGPWQQNGAAPTAEECLSLSEPGRKVLNMLTGSRLDRCFEQQLVL